MLLFSICAGPQNLVFLKYLWKNPILFCGTEPVNKCWYDLYYIGIYFLESWSVYIENEATVIFQKSELSS